MRLLDEVLVSDESDLLPPAGDLGPAVDIAPLCALFQRDPDTLRSLLDYSDLQPPWPRFWVEGRTVSETSTLINDWGIFFSSAGPDEAKATLEKAYTNMVGLIGNQVDHGTKMRSMLMDEIPRASIVLSGTLIAKMASPARPVGLWLFLVLLDQNGKLIEFQNGMVSINAMIGNTWPQILRHVKTGVLDYQEILDFGTTCFSKAIASIQFLNCKNVRAEPCSNRIPDRTTRLEWRKRCRAKGIPYPDVRYHVLKVDRPGGGRAGLEHVGSGTEQALHLVRGHRRDCTERGLFGREELKGRFWIPAHLRGDPELGKIVKDYQVGPK